MCLLHLGPRSRKKVSRHSGWVDGIVSTVLHQFSVTGVEVEIVINCMVADACLTGTVMTLLRLGASIVKPSVS